MSTQLKDKLVVRDHEGQFHVWTKAEYEAYVTDAIWMGATPSISIVTHFAGTEDLLKDVASHEASAPLPTELEEAAKEAAEHYIEDETLQFQTVCRQQGYSLDIIEEWAKVDYRKGFLAGSRYQSQASLPGDLVERLKRINPYFKKEDIYGIGMQDGWDNCTDKLRELLSQHSATEQKQESADIKISAELPYHEEFEKWVKGIRKGKNTTMADLYYYWIENIREQKSVSAQVSLKDHAVGFAEYLNKNLMSFDGFGGWVGKINTNAVGSSSDKIYDSWPGRKQSKPDFLTAELHECLKTLVELKQYKDQYGKSPEYIIGQPKAWENAKQLLEKLNQQP